jgi:hypothetical protein
MFTERDWRADEYRRQDFLRTAEHERLIRSLPGQTPLYERVLKSMMFGLGTALEALGERLQSLAPPENHGSDAKKLRRTREIYG